MPLGTDTDPKLCTLQKHKKLNQINISQSQPSCTPWCYLKTIPDGQFSNLRLECSDAASPATKPKQTNPQTTFTPGIPLNTTLMPSPATSHCLMFLQQNLLSDEGKHGTTQ
eukprot:GHUV01027187.1.p1 GENE.GHUV01027187.1~~GHUV01027187.1.p1  ORF type:complete len:111 (-),score=21.92 GHUV01027187.1:241-573(-)